MTKQEQSHTFPDGPIDLTDVGVPTFISPGVLPDGQRYAAAFMRETAGALVEYPLTVLAAAARYALEEQGIGMPDDTVPGDSSETTA